MLELFLVYIVNPADVPSTKMAMAYERAEGEDEDEASRLVIVFGDDEEDDMMVLLSRVMLYSVAILDLSKRSLDINSIARTMRTQGPLVSWRTRNHDCQIYLILLCIRDWLSLVYDVIKSPSLHQPIEKVVMAVS